jgi:NNP family nitrate/nitrite transporter-like MFS transporter
MGLSKQYAGTYMWGFLLFAVLTLGVLAMMRSMQMRWTRTWAEKGGRARTA